MIYCVDELLPYSREIALAYKMEPTSASCRHNAEVRSDIKPHACTVTVVPAIW